MENVHIAVNKGYESCEANLVNILFLKGKEDVYNDEKEKGLQNSGKKNIFRDGGLRKLDDSRGNSHIVLQDTVKLLVLASIINVRKGITEDNETAVENFMDIEETYIKEVDIDSVKGEKTVLEENKQTVLKVLEVGF